MRFGKKKNTREIAIGVVTFNPGQNLFSRLRLASTSGFTLYIFDNSPEDNRIQVFCNNTGNCRYYTCGKNVGLGFAISTICAQAYYESQLALIFFDQDTVFDKSTLEFVEHFYISTRKIMNSYSAIVFNSKNIGNENSLHPHDSFSFKNVMLAPNSGSLYFLENLKKMNWHNQTYFVDGIDYEFCLNSQNMNFKIGECSIAPGFDHRSEQGDIRCEFFGKVLLLRQYSTARILDACSANVRLFIAALRTGNFRFAIQIARLFSSYITLQLLVRLIDLFRCKKGGA